MNDAEQFFYDNAGFSHAPDETPEEGRKDNAKELAEAEAWAREEGFTFEWSVDPAGDHWECVARDGGGKPAASRHGIDFGRAGVPWDAPHKRVVEAELANDVQERRLVAAIRRMPPLGD